MHSRRLIVLFSCSLLIPVYTHALLSTTAFLPGGNAINTLERSLTVCEDETCNTFSKPLCEHYLRGFYDSAVSRIVASALPPSCLLNKAIFSRQALLLPPLVGDGRVHTHTIKE